MLTKLYLKNSIDETIRAAVHADLYQQRRVIRMFVDNAARAAEYTDFYNNVATVVISGMHSKGAKSGDVTMYDTLANGVYYGRVLLSIDRQYAEFTRRGVARLKKELTKRYRKRIYAAIEKGRDYINLSTPRTVERLLRYYVNQQRDIALKLAADAERANVTETERAAERMEKDNAARDSGANYNMTIEKRVIDGVETDVFCYHANAADGISDNGGNGGNAAAPKKNTVIPFSFEIVHDIIAFLTEHWNAAAERRADSNAILSALNVPFDEFREKLRGRLHTITERVYELKDNDFTRDNFIPRTDADGNIKRAADGTPLFMPRGIFRAAADGSVTPRAVLKTNVFNGVEFIDELNAADGSNVIVTRFISFYDALYQITEKAMQRKRRRAVSEKSIDNGADVDGTPIYNDMDVTNAAARYYAAAVDLNAERVDELTDIELLYNSLYAALLMNGMRAATADKFLLATIYHDLGYSKTNAAAAADININSYNNQRRKHYDLIHNIAQKAADGLTGTERAAARALATLNAANVKKANERAERAAERANAAAAADKTTSVERAAEFTERRAAAERRANERAAAAERAAANAAAERIAAAVGRAAERVNIAERAAAAERAAVVDYFRARAEKCKRRMIRIRERRAGAAIVNYAAV